MTRLLAWLGQLPSTNARVAVTLVCVFGTAVRYWLGHGWAPSGEWLAFLAAMSGIDGAVFFAKRKTDAGYTAANNGIPGPDGPTSNEKQP